MVEAIIIVVAKYYGVICYGPEKGQNKTRDKDIKQGNILKYL